MSPTLSLPPMPRDPQRRAIHWTDAELDAMTSPEALAAPEVTAEARQWWHRHAAPADRNLLDPEPVDDQPPPAE